MADRELFLRLHHLHWPGAGQRVEVGLSGLVRLELHQPGALEEDGVHHHQGGAGAQRT